MAAQQLKTFSDIYSAVLEELKIQSTDTTSLNRIKRDINATYLDEVLPFADWKWARLRKDVVSQAYVTGTVSVTNGSTSITFSSGPTLSQSGKLFQVNGYAEIYRITSHTAGATSATINTKYTGTTSSSATYKTWANGIPLPVEMIETYKVWHDHDQEPMVAIGDRKLLELQLSNPGREGRPKYYSLSDHFDPQQYNTITGLPSTSTRASAGYVRTIVFNDSVASLLDVGDVIEVTGVNDDNYVGSFVVESVSTTTITYIGNTYFDEAATADGMNVRLQGSKEDAEVFKKLEIWPYLSTEDTTIHVEGIRKAIPLENDSDEPLIPISDRIVLLYGALMRAWSRQRNPEEANRNAMLFDRKLTKMAGKIQDSTDMPNLSVSQIYLKGKRAGRRSGGWTNF